VIMDAHFREPYHPDIFMKRSRPLTSTMLC
jgi:hypothetical protein